MSARNLLKAAIVLVLATWALPSLACPVCFGDSDSEMAKGAQASILFLGILTYVVIVGGIATVIFLRIHARRKTLEAASAAQGP